MSTKIGNVLNWASEIDPGTIGRLSIMLTWSGTTDESRTGEENSVRIQHVLYQILN